MINLGLVVGRTYPFLVPFTGYERFSSHVVRELTVVHTHILCFNAGHGNMVSDGSRTLGYDDDNRPVTVGTVTYVYGPDGKRLKKISGTGTTLYLGADVEYANGVWTKYLHADVKVVGTGASTVTSWLHRDHLASVRKITTAAGTVAEGTAYKPSGRPARS